MVAYEPFTIDRTLPTTFAIHSSMALDHLRMGFNFEAMASFDSITITHFSFERMALMPITIASLHLALLAIMIHLTN